MTPPPALGLPPWLVWVFVTAVSMILIFGSWEIQKLWPPLAAVAVILATRNALAGLLTGGFVGALLLAQGRPLVALASVATDHLLPSLQSPWRSLSMETGTPPWNSPDSRYGRR